MPLMLQTRDKARFVSIAQSDYLGNIPELEIKIDFNDKEKTLSITDTGIGMTKADSSYINFINQ